MNVVDNIVSFFDPNAGFKRAQKRQAIKLLKRGFEGARKDRRTKGWRVNELDNDIKLSELQTLSARSRDLYRNNPYANNAHSTIANSITGTGILPAIQDKVKKVWESWADNIYCDFDENLNFYGIQNLCALTLSINGEVLVLRVKTKSKNNNVPLELKVVTAKYLDTTKDVAQLNGGGYISGGIQYDKFGKRIGYYIFDTDPNISLYTQSTFWNKEDVIHLFKVDEPGQSRGVAFGSSSMMNLRDYDDYADAQLVRQKIAACFAAFVTSEYQEGVPDSTAENGILEKMEPGTIEHLEPGKEISFASPPPTDGYADYSRNILTGIASGFGVTYESMTSDLSNVNFSSGRMGWLNQQAKIETYQWFIIVPKFCDTVWLWFVEAAILAGLINKTTNRKIAWTTPRREMIDPVKETNGLLAKVRGGLMSWQEAVRSLGFTPEEILEEMKASKKMFDDAELQPECDPRYDVKTPYGTEPEEKNANTNKG